MSDHAENEKRDGSEDSKVYDYLKEHPSVLIACVSAIVAAGTFIMNAVIYYIDSRYFQFWGYEINQCDYKNPNQIYIIAITFVFLVAINLFQRHSNNIISVYFDRTAWIHIEKKMLRVLSKLSTEQKKSIKSARSDLKKTGNKKKPKEHGTISCNDYERQIREHLSRIKGLRKKLKHEKWIMIRQLIVPLIPPASIIFLVSIVFFSAVGTAKLTPGLNVLFSLTYVFILLCLAFFSLYGIKRLTLIHRTSKCKDNYCELEQLLDKTTEDHNKEYPTSNWKNIRIKDILKGSQIRIVALSALGLLITYYVVNSLFTTSIQSSRKVFPVCYVDETPYIIVYQSSNTYYLNQSEISDGQITIDVRSHRVINSDDVTFISTEFEKVTILRD